MSGRPLVVVVSSCGVIATYEVVVVEGKEK
jgi:hypothetical protein